MVDVTEISAIVVALGVVVGVVYYILDLRHQTKIRQTDLIFRITPWFNLSPERFAEAANTMMTLRYKDYDDFVQKYGSLYSGKPVPTTVRMVMNWGDGVGMLYKRKLIDINTIIDAYGGVVPSFWEKLKPLVEGWRKEFNDPAVWSSLEYLVNEVKKREPQLLAERCQ